MATVGIVSVGITGRINTSCEIVGRLQARGHRVVIASTNTKPQSFLMSAGVQFHLLDGGVSADLQARSQSTPRKGARWRRVQIEVAEARGRAALRGHGIDEFLSLYRPDLLLIESELHNSILYLRGHRTPVVLLEYHVSVHRVHGVPPLDSMLLPGTAFASLRAELAWRWMLLKRRLRQRMQRHTLKRWDTRSVWERLARAADVRLKDIADDDQWPLLLHSHLPSIHLCAPELDFPASHGPARQFAGPVTQRRRDDPPGDEDAERCRRLLANRDDKRPLVVSATGSILTLPDFTRKLLQVADGAGFDLIVGAGQRVNMEQLSELPANVSVFGFIPQLEVLACADVFVCHGGIASVHESLLFGVPMLVCSGGRLDENGNAARVEYHGLGMRGDMSRESATVLRGKIEALIASEEIRRSLASFRETLLGYEMNKTLELLVESHLPAETGS